MKVLVIGSGGREHSIVWKLSKSASVDKIYCAPGNPGIAELAETVDIGVEDIDGLAGFAEQEGIDLTVVGPEQPLVMGIADCFESKGLKVFGPDKECSRLEASKVFSKAFMKKYGIPTARYEEYTALEDAISGLRHFDLPVVIKADGLAAGKGVVIADNRQEAAESLRSIMEGGEFGSAGQKVIVEEFLDGTEASVMCLVDGETIMPMESARDYKRAFDRDKGLNTGGMGAYSPNEIYGRDIFKAVEETVLKPIAEGLKKEGMRYKGVLFIGLMIVVGVPKVLEFNVRFGDPETQVLLPRMKTDLVDIIEAVLSGNLSELEIEWTEECALCVVISSEGYPEKYEVGKEITMAEGLEEGLVFHSGTKIVSEKLVTNGGRVLVVTSLGKTREQARAKAYKNAEKIIFKGKRCRNDIGQ